MGVTYKGCECCTRGVYAEYIDNCSKCNKQVCVSCLSNKDIQSKYSNEYNLRFDGSEEQKEEYGIKTKEEDPEWGMEIGEVINDVGYDPKYCPFCSGKIITDTQLLEYLLELYGHSRDEVRQQYKKYHLIDE